MTDFIIDKWLTFTLGALTLLTPLVFWIIRRAWKRRPKPTGSTMADLVERHRLLTDAELRDIAHNPDEPAASRIAAKMVLRTRQ